ncbi:hypothetical protein DAPPUDRAFT_106265 [Daphnia pulex]|uniref:Uncharacterized protein n=1 Tax=Daphnia pulex TaxID=6669 RepID=E9GT39_DAPPU|nr:hypothetical protein DAPPUDRAFT_106265 [Daphnia pulex]|eukprot:EFX77303.1 hypothetical protein DAPPUDRAFT_106265 [Daphnia pulex]
MDWEIHEFDGKNDINNNGASYPAKSKKNLITKKDDELQESITKRPRREAFKAEKSRIQKMYSEKGNKSLRQENVEESKYVLHERAVRQRGASRQAREGNGKPTQ